ncbi:MAG: FliA/WhiG family RNA polymerase sigma factor [candidate division Zixibacteria bacterium]
MSNLATWERFRETNDSEMRDQLLNQYLQLVKNVAGRMAAGFPKSVELNDLINTGVIGLIEAFNNFDPSRGVKFETFAVPRIRGAILDELRALDWVPRSTRAKARNIDRALMKLENELGRGPSEKELATRMEISVDDLFSARKDVSVTSLLSLDELICREDDNRQVPRIETIENTTTIDVLKDMEKVELRAYLLQAISTLTEQERLVVSLYYYEELTLKEIGDIMLISESRVSQIHTRAVSRLRGMIRDKFAV